jgi:hypothetical protein
VRAVNGCGGLYRLRALLNGICWNEGGTNLLRDASSLTILHETAHNTQRSQLI